MVSFEDFRAIRAGNGDQALAAGKGWLDPSVTRELLHDLASRPVRSTSIPAEIARHASREREVFEAIADGATTAQMAEALSLRGAAAKTHVHRVFLKRGLTDRSQAVVIAYHSGLATSSDPVRRERPLRR